MCPAKSNLGLIQIKGDYMSPKKKKKHYEKEKHSDYMPHQIHQNDRRGKRNYMIKNVDTNYDAVIDWEAENWQEIYI